MKTLENTEIDNVIRIDTVDTDFKFSRYFDNDIRRETKKGTLTYDLLCGLMSDRDGKKILIRKDLNLHSDDRDDWLVVTYTPGENPVEEVVIASNTTNTESGDRIKLEIAPERNGLPNYYIEFGVDELYAPDGDSIVKSHPERLFNEDGGYQEVIDTIYDTKIDIYHNKPHSYLAEVISLDEYRSKVNDIGRTAVNN